MSCDMMHVEGKTSAEEKMMGIAQNWQATCGDCGTKGPEGQTTAEARQSALTAGWSIGGRRGSTVLEDYCPRCKKEHNRIQCQHKAEDPCRSDSRYRLTRAAGLYTLNEIAAAMLSAGIDPDPVTEKLGARITDDCTWWCCGKHLPVFMRDMFNATPEPVVASRVS